MTLYLRRNNGVLVGRPSLMILVMSVRSLFLLLRHYHGRYNKIVNMTVIRTRRIACPLSPRTNSVGKLRRPVFGRRPLAIPPLTRSHRHVPTKIINFRSLVRHPVNVIRGLVTPVIDNRDRRLKVQPIGRTPLRPVILAPKVRNSNNLLRRPQQRFATKRQRIRLIGVHLANGLVHLLRPRPTRCPLIRHNKYRLFRVIRTARRGPLPNKRMNRLQQVPNDLPRILCLGPTGDP